MVAGTRVPPGILTSRPQDGTSLGRQGVVSGEVGGTGSQPCTLAPKERQDLNLVTRLDGADPGEDEKPAPEEARQAVTGMVVGAHGEERSQDSGMRRTSRPLGPGQGSPCQPSGQLQQVTPNVSAGTDSPSWAWRAPRRT